MQDGWDSPPGLWKVKGGVRFLVGKSGAREAWAEEPSPQAHVGWGFPGGAGPPLVYGGAGRQAGAGLPQISGEAGSQGWDLFTGRGGASQVTEGWGLAGPEPLRVGWGGACRCLGGCGYSLVVSGAAKVHSGPSLSRASFAAGLRLQQARSLGPGG